jgi:hypothetical protein
MISRECKLEVVRLLDDNTIRGPQYVVSLYGGGRATQHPSEATDLSGMEPDDKVKYLIDCQKYFRDHFSYKFIDLVTVTVTISEEPVDLSDLELKEALQRQALEKLTTAEIESLNALDILMYHKLRTNTKADDHELDMPF